MFKVMYNGAGQRGQSASAAVEEVIALLNTQVIAPLAVTQPIRPQDCFLPLLLSGNFVGVSHGFRMLASPDEPMAERLTAAVLDNVEAHYSLESRLTRIIHGWDARSAPFCDPDGNVIGQGQHTAKVYLDVATELVAGNVRAVVLRKLTAWTGRLLAEPFVLGRNVDADSVKAILATTVNPCLGHPPEIHWTSLTATQRHGTWLPMAA